MPGHDVEFTVILTAPPPLGRSTRTAGGSAKTLKRKPQRRAKKERAAAAAATAVEPAPKKRRVVDMTSPSEPNSEPRVSSDRRPKRDRKRSRTGDVPEQPALPSPQNVPSSISVVQYPELAGALDTALAAALPTSR